MKIVKALAVIISVSLLFSVLTISGAATASPEIKVSTVSAAPGETIDIPISFLNNPGINSYSLSIAYDTAYLTLDGVTSNVEGQFSFIKKAVWLGSGDNTYSGEFLTLRFTVSESAPEGKIPVSVSYNQGDICNYNEEDIAFSVTSGGVEVKNKAEEAPQIKVGTASAAPGANVDIPIAFLNNPGINSYSLSFQYDDTYLTLDSVTSNVDGQFSYVKRAVWIGSGDNTYSGIFLTLHFTVSADAPSGDYPVSVSYKAGDICNFNEDDVSFSVEGGAVSVTGMPVLLGDLNGDGKLTAVDVNLAKRMIVALIPFDLKADLNGDSKVTSADISLLKRIIVGGK